MRIQLKRKLMSVLASAGQPIPLKLLKASVQTRRSPGGSTPGKRPNIDRDREQGHDRIFKDYFSDQPTYDESIFRRRLVNCHQLSNCMRSK